MSAPAFERRTVDQLAVDDERSFRHVAIYADLKEVLRRARYTFRILPESVATWDRALFLNLTYWTPEGGGDVLVEPRIDADVLAHAAWHHLAAAALPAPPGAPPSVDALFLGEAIASAFDVYLVGRLLGHAPRSSFLATQVPAMAESAQGAGLDARGFEVLLGEIAADPDGAFRDLRALLSDAMAALFAARDADHALSALATFEAHRFAPLLHRFELSNWILYARAYGAAAFEDPRAETIDRALRTEASPVDWLSASWIAPALA